MVSLTRNCLCSTAIEWLRSVHRSDKVFQPFGEYGADCRQNNHSECLPWWEITNTCCLLYIRCDTVVFRCICWVIIVACASAYFVWFTHTCAPVCRGRAGIVITLCVCVFVCLQGNCLMHWWMSTILGIHGKGWPVEVIKYWCWSDSWCRSRITFPLSITLWDGAFYNIF